ncbi:MAG: potassium channel family protein [Burkholderiales bacterium]
MIKKQFVVIGMGHFGQAVAKSLSRLGEEVLAVDIDEERINDVAPYVTHAVQADATDEKALAALGIRNFDVAVVTMSTDIEASIFITMLCKEMGVNFVVAKAQSELHGKMLHKTGADKVIYPERDMGLRVAHNLAAANILDYIELTGDIRVVEIFAVEEWTDKSLMELDFRRKYSVNVIAIKKADGTMNTLPKGVDVIEKGDLLIVIGDQESIEKMERVAKR